MKWSWHFFEITWLHMQGFCPVSDTGVPAEPTASQPGWHLSWKKQRWTPLSTLGESRQVRTETRWLALKSALLCPETGSHDGWLQGEVGLAIKTPNAFLLLLIWPFSWVFAWLLQISDHFPGNWQSRFWQILLVFLMFLLRDRCLELPILTFCWHHFPRILLIFKKLFWGTK